MGSCPVSYKTSCDEHSVPIHHNMSLNPIIERISATSRCLDLASGIQYFPRCISILRTKAGDCPRIYMDVSHVIQLRQNAECHVISENGIGDRMQSSGIPLCTSNSFEIFLRYSAWYKAQKDLNFIFLTKIIASECLLKNSTYESKHLFNL